MTLAIKQSVRRKSFLKSLESLAQTADARSFANEVYRQVKAGKYDALEALLKGARQNVRYIDEYGQDDKKAVRAEKVETALWAIKYLKNQELKAQGHVLRPMAVPKPKQASLIVK